MYSDDQDIKRNNINENLGLFLPTSILPDILNDSELNSSKFLYKNFMDHDYQDTIDTKTNDMSSTNENNFNKGDMLFNPKGRYYSHSGVVNFSQPNSNSNFMRAYNNFNNFPNMNNNNFINNNNFYNYGENFPQRERPWQHQTQNQVPFQNFSPYANNSPMSQNNSRAQINNFHLNQIKSHEIKNFHQNNKFSLKTSAKYFSNDTDSNSNQDCFNIGYSNSSNTQHEMNYLEKSMGNMYLENPKKKTFSTGNLSSYPKNIQNKNEHFIQGNNNKKKKHSLFNNKDHNKKREEDEENLQAFIENLEIDLHKYICSQKGSRIMQKFLKKITPENLDYFLNCLGYNIPALMTDIYGNYFCQKLVQSCSAEQRITMLNFISSEIINISYDNSGTHALQSLLEIINLQEEEAIILKAIKNNALDMSYDNNATHVIQKIIICISEEKREFLNRIVIKNLKSLSMDSNGICVVKKLINANKSEDIKLKVIDEIFFNCLEIVQSPFGNYAIQHLLEEWGILSCKKVITVIQQNIISLSMQKYSSNVVERILEMTDKEMKKSIIKEIINPSKLLGLLKNKYGSFVLQKAVSYLEPSEKLEMKNLLQNKINVTSVKEKARINIFFELLD